MTKPRVDDDRLFWPRSPETLDGFLPEIRTEPASVAGSVSSENAGDRASHAVRQANHEAILAVLGRLDAWESLSMAEIAQETGIPLNVVCLRIRVGELRPLFVETVKGARRSLAKSNLHVDGFRLTQAGRDRLREAA